MGDADNRGKMEKPNASDEDEPTGGEKKMRVDEGEVEDAEMTSVDLVDSVVSGEGMDKDKPNSNLSSSNGSCPAPATTEQDNNAEPSTDDCSTTNLDNKVDSQDITNTLTSPSPAPSEEDFGEEIDLKIMFNKKPLSIKIAVKKTIGDLKLLIEKETNLPPSLQKVLLKGIPKDDVTLESLGVTKSTKILVIGTTLHEVMEVTKPPDAIALAAEDLSSKKDAANWCTLTQHKKVLDKGVPEDVMPGILNESEPLPEIPLFGMLNSKGGKVRLTFKLETDELWIGTKERTDKVPIGSIRNIESQPIIGYEHYHIVAIQLGPTEASRYFVYWVPSQYVDAIKDSIAN